MKLNLLIVVSAAMVTVAAAAPAALAQATQPAAASPATQPGDQLIALVDSVTGSVLKRPEAGGKFEPVKAGDRLPAGTLITAGSRSQAVISFGDNSVVVIEQFSTMTIAECYRKAQADVPTVVTRLKLRNGSVRAGVERGRTQSDFQVATPVATLSVRGTRPVRASYDSGTGQLWMFLAREGQLRGQMTGGGRSVNILPGQGTNQSLTLPVLMARFDRHVQMGDPFGETLKDIIVQVTNPSRVGGFGGGSPQTIGQTIPSGSISGGGDDFFGDDDFYGDDDDASITSPYVKKKKK